MSRQARRDTGIEVALRRELHRRGLRYRVHQTVPALGRRRPIDIVFRGSRVAVFVDGCFWHSCPEHGTLPSSNRSWWQGKLALNRARDADADMRLRNDGWVVVRVWEHEDPVEAATRVERAVRNLPTERSSA